jgi:putative restriction endonuclease
MPENIPVGIKTTHILEAISRYDQEVEHQFHDSTTYDILYNGHRYPPKAILGLSAEVLTGIALGPKDFSGGLESKCFQILKQNGFEIVPKIKESSACWLFQGNPYKYDIDEYLNQYPYIYWRAPTNRAQIKIGDRCFIWRSGKNAGAVAVGVIMELPQQAQNVSKPDCLGDELWHEDKQVTAPDAILVGIKIEEVRLDVVSRYISRGELISNSILGNSTIITSPQGTVFSFDPEQAAEIFALWNTPPIIKKSYWWVNHKQTYRSEVEGGYIWSPKENRNGGKNQTYLNLKEVAPSDVVISYADTRIKAVGVATSVYREQGKPVDFGSSGDGWASQGWAVSIDWFVLDSPIKPKSHIDQIRPLLPAKHSPLQSNGNGNQGCYLASISSELGSLLTALIVGENSGVSAVVDDATREQIERKIEREIQKGDMEPTEKDQIVKARIGQGQFRSNVQDIEPRCRVTKVSRREFLIASHIKPWRSSNNQERLDGNNGLLLAPHIDKLFDKGWISFEQSGHLLCADPEIESLLINWGVDCTKDVGGFTLLQEKYLSYHRRYLFKGK